MSLFLILIFPTLAAFRRASLPWLLAAAALGFGAASFWEWQLVQWPSSMAAGGDLAFHDTYYILSKSRTYALLAALFAALSLVHAATQRLSGHMFANLRLVGFACLLLGTAANTSGLWLWVAAQGMPRRYKDYPEAFARLELFSTFCAFLTAIGLAALCLLWLWANGSMLWKKYR